MVAASLLAMNKAHPLEFGAAHREGQGAEGPLRDALAEAAGDPAHLVESRPAPPLALSRRASRDAVHHEGRQHGRAAEQHRSTDRDRAGGRQRVAHQPLETDLVGRRAGAQHPVPVRQPIAVPQDAAGAVVGLYDPPTPVQVEDAYPWVVEQGGHGRVPRLGADQRLPDTDELTDMGQQFRDQGSQ